MILVESSKVWFGILMRFLSYSIRGLVAILLAISFSTAIADERKYGSFVYNSDIPNALFFMEEIKRGDNFELRKALRNHDIDTIILASPGGSVWAGLSMAGIIFDKELRVYVPPKGVCASACSFMFFGGAERLSEGQLGVHQFASSDTSKNANAAKTQAESQFTVSEIIGFMNEFETPRFVLERMFEDRQMYWFNEEETAQLNSKDFSLELSIRSTITSYTSAKLKEAKVEKAKRPKYSKKELIALIQKRLNVIGCSAGAADGVWGRRTNAAAVRFATKAGLPNSREELISEAFFGALVNAKKGFCPKPKITNPQTFASVYDTNCNGGPNIKGASVVTERHDKRKKVVHLLIRPNGETDALKYSGKSFTSTTGVSGRLFFNSKGYVYKITFGNEYCSRITLQARK